MNFKFMSRRGQRLVSSTFVSKNDDSDFVAVESPISFNKRKLSEKQKEKMKEKRDARSGLNFDIELYISKTSSMFNLPKPYSGHVLGMR